MKNIEDLNYEHELVRRSFWRAIYITSTKNGRGTDLSKNDADNALAQYDRRCEGDRFGT